MPDNQKKRIFNPDEHRVHMRRIKGPAGKIYHIGNCHMDLNIKDTVIKFFPPRTDDENDKHGFLVINNYKFKIDKEDEYDDDYEDGEYEDDEK